MTSAPVERSEAPPKISAIRHVQRSCAPLYSRLYRATRVLAASTLMTIALAGCATQQAVREHRPGDAPVAASRQAAWDRDEWDVLLADGVACRVFLERDVGQWFVEGTFD